MTSDPHELVRIAFAGNGDIEEWRLGNADRARAKGYPREFATPVLDDAGTVFVDVTLEHETRSPVCHEVNGPNGVGTDALTGESSMRAGIEARQAVRRARELGLLDGSGEVPEPVVTVHAHQHWSAFRTGGEFYPRVDRFRDLLRDAMPGNVVRMRGAHEHLGEESVAVVLGAVPAVAAGLTLDATFGFRYQGRPVIFAGNPNLLPELERTGTLSPTRLEHGPDAMLRSFHAWRLSHVFHDKVRQQSLLRGTGIRPLRSFEARDRDEAVERATDVLGDGPCVLKPRGASGGVGVHVLVPEMTRDEIAVRVDAVLTDAVAKYGPNTERVVYPIAGFEFVRSTGYPMDDGDHVWDLRIAVLFEQGRAWAFPVSMRLAPRPFGPTSFWLDRDQWVSNVSGRQATLLKSGMDDDALVAMGIDEERLELMISASVKWTTNAWDAATRDGGQGGAVYEDECELVDADFYPTEKFR
jgi:hypothetical protein